MVFPVISLRPPGVAVTFILTLIFFSTVSESLSETLSLQFSCRVQMDVSLRLRNDFEIGIYDDVTAIT